MLTNKRFRGVMLYCVPVLALLAPGVAHAAGTPVPEEASKDAAYHWVQATASAPWQPRAAHQTLILNGRICLLGGG